jgi:hypothetical protein
MALIKVVIESVTNPMKGPVCVWSGSKEIRCIAVEVVLNVHLQERALPTM